MNYQPILPHSFNRFIDFRREHPPLHQAYLCGYTDINQLLYAIDKGPNLPNKLSSINILEIDEEIISYCTLKMQPSRCLKTTLCETHIVTKKNCDQNLLRPLGILFYNMIKRFTPFAIHSFVSPNDLRLKSLHIRLGFNFDCSICHLNPDGSFIRQERYYLSKKNYPEIIKISTVQN